jgi:hypothetical protein
MSIALQSVVIAVVVAAAAVYVVRSWLPRKNAQPGCGSCPANPNQGDDYT